MSFYGTPITLTQRVTNEFAGGELSSTPIIDNNSVPPATFPNDIQCQTQQRDVHARRIYGRL